MKKIIRLTESDLTRIIKRVIKENEGLSEMEDVDFMKDADRNWKPEKSYASFGGEEWFDDENKPTKDFDFDFDEEEFDDLDSFEKKYPKQSKKRFGKGDLPRHIFKKYRDERGPMKYRTRRYKD